MLGKSLNVAGAMVLAAMFGVPVWLAGCTAQQEANATMVAGEVCATYQTALKLDPALATHNPTLVSYGNIACAAAPTVIMAIPQTAVPSIVAAPVATPTAVAPVAATPAAATSTAP